jgi:hypothetical protein
MYHDMRSILDHQSRNRGWLCIGRADRVYTDTGALEDGFDRSSGETIGKLIIADSRVPEDVD